MKVYYDQKEIEFEVKYRKRKTLKILVKPTLEVEVVSPLGVTDKCIKEIILRRASWILNKREYFEKFSPQIISKNYVSGEIHSYLGVQYRLKVIEAERNHVSLKGEYIYIHTIHKNNNEYNKELLYRWYKEKSKKIFEELFIECYEKVKKYDLKKPTWGIRKMKARWGSYHINKNHILLNVELIKGDIDEIKYVIMHELSHIKHPNHSKEFYKFMDLIMPNWREKRVGLEKILFS
ncbi:M48 family metallopeptidase [Clostridium botulinum]|uniref:Zinc metalloprotease n=1 Tax=Clostridium botulinum TaxID=1491 RepID=A0A9Q1UZ67_CLOBO|nr:SprT family zinc-dependent metalloprotease [Clostridium botulinum]AEB76481.1 Zinc metalloprotease, putative [Clostridium botulinum BKT015925]KEH97493.1 zinc metalloprotease [Clostridium botulinum D str. 16868]KEI03434.1 zinc metalloprotease [Clostridium botulinum C/D str. Sp77]KLU76137.1 zinc metalloprotease [Clostridium botulinum V891]KOA74070.1 zinc metalloprotease [Clostridium botulinum]